MKIVIGTSTDPYFNLAMEEYFLKQKDEDFFMLWRNDKSVIVGKNQNAHAEINHDFVEKNNIKVVRRMTGGGAVFHDLGNVNYTFIIRNKKESFNDYAYFCRPVISYLNSLGVAASLSGRNDMLIGDKKFSGNAQCAYKESVMHHGTLLYSSNMSEISGALNVNPLKIKSKGIASVRSRVTNISEHLKAVIDIREFMNGIKNHVINEVEGSSIYELTDNDYRCINTLAREKYSTWEWNFGFKQEYTVTNEMKYPFGLVQVNLMIKDNCINLIKFFGDFFGIRDIEILENAIKGALYNREIISNLLNDFEIDDYIKGMSASDLLQLFFV